MPEAQPGNGSGQAAQPLQQSPQTPAGNNGLRVQLTSRRNNFLLDLQHDFEPAGITAIFGPSGSGKSTLLSMIAGFSRPNISGTLAMGQEHWLAAGRR
ncbi:MAG: ATP-binding cassette domain-containing protein, partial [Pseudomonadales bacterium]|nr:ATP-binding cassette domain-containing protein [Pseudomonadales bacterium]